MGVLDILRRALTALAARPSRSALSAVGVAIGVGALVGVLGVSSSIQAGLLSKLTALGDVLTVEASSGSSNAATIPEYSLKQLQRIPTVEAVAGTTTLGASARRTDNVPATQSGGVSVVAFDGDIVSATDTRVVDGRPVDGTSPLPEALVGWEAAQTLGVTARELPLRVAVGNVGVVVVGILGPTPVESSVDHFLLLPTTFAETLGFESQFDTVYLRVPIEYSPTVSSLAVPTIDPSGSAGLQVSLDSTALIAAGETATAFQGLLLALAGVGLLVAVFGVTNTLTIAVVERRAEIGIRRALGATRLSIAGLFLIEGTVISACGGLAGVVLGTWATMVAAWQQGVAPDIPLSAPLLGIASSIIVALAAAPYPAIRAATLPPNDALRTML